MNKKAIKEFAVWARRRLISDITYRAGMIGITEEVVSQPLSSSADNVQFFDIGTGTPTEIRGAEIRQREALVKKIQEKEKNSDYKTAFQYVIEETAYTWFNRLIAIRFMEVNDYLPSGVRVLSSETEGKNEPDMVTNPFDTDLDFTEAERSAVVQFKTENQLDRLFRMLFIKQCNKLNEILPELFEKTEDYTELLLNISFTDAEGVVAKLVSDIEEDDFNVEKEGQIEIIGWLYQYYNSEPKDEVFALLKKNVKITKERIPAATQLFTPHWIVRYMVENSLGRLWLEGHPNEAMKESWKYYLDEAEQEPEVLAQLEEIRASYRDINPEDIRIMDPSMGSGHILVYAFDVLMQIYESSGYMPKDAVKAIIEKNLYGLDIDKRAYQLSYFAVMMKARQYSRRVFREKLKPNLYAICDSSNATNELIEYIADGNEAIRRDLKSIVADLKDAEDYGSIIDVVAVDFDAIYARLEELKDEIHIFAHAALETVLPLVKQAEAMVQKYDVVVTNPPYMGLSGGSSKLNSYVKKYYPDSKADMFAVFMERCTEMTEKNRFCAMITQHSWMFLSSFEKLRGKLQNLDMVNMAHLGARAFAEIGGEVVQTTSFILQNCHGAGRKGIYCRLIEPTTQDGKEEMFLAGENRYEAVQDNFVKIPGAPIIYNFPNKIFTLYDSSPKTSQMSTTRLGMTTANNELFVRLWHEVSLVKCIMNAQNGEEVIQQKKIWTPYNKGGYFRKWYGNLDCLVNWDQDGYAIKHYGEAEGHIRSTVPNTEYYFRECGTWSKVSSGNFAMRYRPKGSIFDVAGACLFTDTYNDLLILIGFMNSVIAKYLLGSLSPTMNFEGGQISNLPIAVEELTDKDLVINHVSKNVTLSKNDWNSYETSWDFKKHPLI